MATIHEMYRFSVTCHTEDKAVMYCLRALAHFAEHHAQKNIAWGGTDDESWQRDGNRITLRFTDPAFRQIFRDVADDLLGGRWEVTSTSENDPATPKGR
jgi:hypothetical protein